MQQVGKLCPIINMNAASDLQVAIQCLRTAVYGAYYNVMINVQSLHWNRHLKEKVGLFKETGSNSSLSERRSEADSVSHLQIQAEVEDRRQTADKLEAHLLSQLMETQRSEV